MFRTSTSLLLEDVIHIDNVDGYQVFSHNPNGNDISNAIDKTLAVKQPKIRIKLSPSERSILKRTCHLCLQPTKKCAFANSQCRKPGFGDRSKTWF